MRKLSKVAFVLLVSGLLLVSLSSGCASDSGGGEQASPSAEKTGGVQSGGILVSTPQVDAAEPSVAAAPGGGVYVVWAEHQPDKRANVLVRRFNGEGAPAGDVVRVNPEAGGATAWRGDPPTIKVGGDGTVYVGWTAPVKVDKGSANDLLLSVSRDGANSFAPPVKVNDDRVPAVHGMHALEVDAGGRVHFAWLDERYLKQGAQQHQDTPPGKSEGGESGANKHQHSEPNREVYAAVSSDGGATFSANRKLAENACPCCKVSMASAADGRLYVSWRQVLDGDFRHIAVSSTADGGSTYSPATIVSDDRWQISACPVSGAGMTVDSAGTLNVAWYTGGKAGAPGVYRAESRDGGRSFLPRALVYDKAASGTPVLVGAEADSQVVFASIDKAVHRLAIQGDRVAERNRIDGGDLPSAAISGNKTFIAFVRAADGGRGVFLSGAE